ncbi:MAG: hypothetical protein GY822_21425 [Deltaproteobacteria bacterium]|nr:hypothetical protein [Deltaproteobacteria bacterium]
MPAVFFWYFRARVVFVACGPRACLGGDVLSGEERSDDPKGTIFANDDVKNTTTAKIVPFVVAS